MKNDKIKVLVKRVGQPATVEVIENTLNAKQAIVGGYIEIPYNPEFSEGLDIVINEEGKYSDDPRPNVYWGDTDVIYGDIFFVGARDGEHISITPKQIEEATNFIAENDASDFEGDPEDLAYVNNRVMTFGSDEAFWRAIAGEMFDDNNDIKPAFQKDKKDMEM